MRRNVDSGIAVTPSFAGVVPEYEMLEAASYGHVSLVEWESLESLDQARIVALYRMHNTIEAHVQDAVNKRGNNQRRSSAGRRPSSSS